MSIADEPVRTDVVVVGAGLAGLTAARLLRHAGRSVVVIDPTEPGGRGRSDRRGAVWFNRGPRALYLGGVADRVLTSLGVPLTGGTPQSGGAGLLGDRLGALPASAATLARTPLLSWRGKLAIGRLMASLPRIDATRLGSTTFADWLADRELPDDARLLVEMLSRVSTYTNAAEIVSADMVIGTMQSTMGRGVRYLDGGWQTIVDSLCTGTRLERGAVEGVRREGNDVVVARADGSSIVGRAAVVAAGGPDVAARLTGRPPFVVGPPAMARCLDLASSAPAHPGLLLGLDTPLYLSNHCPPARLAPDGVSVVHVARYLAPGDDVDPHDGRAELVAHAERAGLTSDRITDARYLHRMTVVGGIAVAACGGLVGRPGAADSGVDGVFLAGDWVGPHGHLLDAAIASAEEAAMRADRFIDAATLVPR